MSIGFVRRTSLLVSCAAAISLAACSSGSVSGPDGLLTVNPDGRATGPSGLEQRVVTRVEAPPAGSPYTALLTATSTLVNKGNASVHVSARTCLATDADIETTARMDRFEPFISCSSVNLETDLAPGQTIGPLEVSFGVRSGPGTYTLKLRHSLAPEFRAEVTFRVP